MGVMLLRVFLLGTFLLQAFPLSRFFEHCKTTFLSLVEKQVPTNPEGPGYANQLLGKDLREGSLQWDSFHKIFRYMENPTRRHFKALIQKEGSRLVLDVADPDPKMVSEGQLQVTMMYVIDASGSVFVGYKTGPQIHADYNGSPGELPHPTLLNAKGEIARALSAGTITFKNYRGVWKIETITNQSGHFKVSSEALKITQQAFQPYKDFFSPTLHFDFNSRW